MQGRHNEFPLHKGNLISVAQETKRKKIEGREREKDGRVFSPLRVQESEGERRKGIDDERIFFLLLV